MVRKIREVRQTCPGLPRGQNAPFADHPAALEKEFKKVRRHGIAYDDEELVN